MTFLKKNILLIIILLLLSCNKKEKPIVSDFNSTDSLTTNNFVIQKEKLTIDTLTNEEVSKYLKIDVCTDKLYNLGDTNPFFRNRDGIILTITNISTKPIYILDYTFGSVFLLKKYSEKYVISPLYNTNTISKFKVKLNTTGKIKNTYGIDSNSDINNNNIEIDYHTIDELLDTSRITSKSYISDIDSIEIGYHIIVVDELYDASIHNEDIQEEHIKWVGNLWYSGKFKKCK